MEAFGIGSIMFLVFAIIGLILLVVGILFLTKNLKWKKEKEQRGEKATINIVAMVLFGCMIFFGAIWFILFGIGAIAFGLLGYSF